ncbi:DUF1802 family protein [Paenibacillus xerothermodurans]|uniref:DUF1802 family protein n=1 Tax=Paenibacillus xerothermodurans TaxID=1977292 RepID=A0A2W1NPL8_PAEXE|nr:DUF1802 family protein [Paenibacillus xerothermodurans]PZE21435.1 DUF1802 family protein [Paenibacillus xerothermodurans]
MKVDTQTMALKEWAVAVEALRTGQQIVIMRKGGIREETKEFHIQSESFFLFPTYEHQQKQWLQPAFAHRIDETLRGWSREDTEAAVRCYAELTEDILITHQEQLAKLSGEHIWTDSFAEERLKWKRAKPLHLMLLRVYELVEPVRVPILPSYTGCKSWIQLEADGLNDIARKPVLDDASFQLAVQRIHSALR